MVGQFPWRFGFIRMGNGLNLIDGLEARERVGGGPGFSGCAWQRVEPHMEEIKADLESAALYLPIGAVT
jgi:hypothetical protein